LCIIRRLWPTQIRTATFRVCHPSPSPGHCPRAVVPQYLLIVAGGPPLSGAARCLSESRPVKMLSSIVKCLLCLLPCGFASFVQLLNNTASILTVAVENPTAQTAGAWTEEVSMDLRFLKISGTVSVSCGLPDSCGEMIFSLAIQVILFSTARCAPQQHFSKFNAANASRFTT
jgi:hypothetical protein